MPVAQGAPDVGFKRKADEDSQIYDWQNDERAFEVQVKQYQKNNDVRTKMLVGAEANKIEAYAEKTKVEAMLLQFDLKQKQTAAGPGTGAKKSETEEEKERRLALNAKRRKSRAQAKAATDKPPTQPKGAA